MIRARREQTAAECGFTNNQHEPSAAKCRAKECNKNDRREWTHYGRLPPPHDEVAPPAMGNPMRLLCRIGTTQRGPLFFQGSYLLRAESSSRQPLTPTATYCCMHYASTILNQRANRACRRIVMPLMLDAVGATASSVSGMTFRRQARLAL